MKENLKVYFIQTDLIWQDKKANLLNLETLITPLNNPDIILLPEMFNTAFCPSAIHLAETMKENTVNWMIKISKKKNCAVSGTLMVKENGGSIINVSSCASSLKGFPNRFVYGTTKGAVIGLTKSIAADFVKQNIRCNSIAPGTVFSPSWQDRVNQSPDPVQAKKDFIARQPMGRLGTAEEIAAVAVYLAGDDATFTTGTTISVDGGISI